MENLIISIISLLEIFTATSSQLPIASDLQRKIDASAEISDFSAPQVLFASWHIPAYNFSLPLGKGGGRLTFSSAYKPLQNAAIYYFGFKADRSNMRPSS